MARQHGSSNWIKVQKHTWKKPEIRQVSRLCDASVAEAFLAFFRLWSYFDEQTKDGFLPFYTPEDADADSGLPGAGRAFASVGWLCFDETGCIVANFDRHNGESTRQRALRSERQARWRSGCVDARPSTRVDACVDGAVDAVVDGAVDAVVDGAVDACASPDRARAKRSLS